MVQKKMSGRFMTSLSGTKKKYNFPPPQEEKKNLACLYLSQLVWIKSKSYQVDAENSLVGTLWPKRFRNIQTDQRTTTTTTVSQVIAPVCGTFGSSGSISADGAAVAGGAISEVEDGYINAFQFITTEISWKQKGQTISDDETNSAVRWRCLRTARS